MYDCLHSPLQNHSFSASICQLRNSSLIKAVAGGEIKTVILTQRSNPLENIRQTA